MKLLVIFGSDSFGALQGDAFSTPTFKPIPNSFVAKRAYHSRTPIYSPLPHEFGDVADEDTWFKMNNGFIADLDSNRMSPPKQLSSIPSINKLHDCSIDNNKEIENLRMQLQQAIVERDEFEKQHKEQLVLNNQLMEEISKLKKEASTIQQIPHKLSESLANCKAVNEDIFSTFQSFAEDDKFPTANLFSKTNEIVKSFMSTFEAQISMAMNREGENLEDEIGNSESHKKYKDCTLETQIASWKIELSDEINLMKERYKRLEQELDTNNHLLEASKARIHGLEKESRILLEEKDDLLLTVSDSSKTIASLNEQNERVLVDLSCEIQRRKDLEEEIKRFSVGFASRYKSCSLFSSELKSKVEHFKAKSFGC